MLIKVNLNTNLLTLGNEKKINEKQKLEEMCDR